MVAQSGAKAEKQRVGGLSPGVDENLGGVLVAGGSPRTPLKCCRSTLGQDNKPPNAPLMSCLHLYVAGRGSSTSCDPKTEEHVCHLLGFFDLRTLGDFIEEDNRLLYRLLGH